MAGKSIIKREQVFLELYKKMFPPVAAYVHKRGGTYNDAKDIFQDALVIYYEKVMVASPSLHQNKNAYLFGIVKHLWNRRFNESITVLPTDFSDEKFSETEDVVYEEASTRKLMQLLNTTGQKCMELLRAFYYDKLSMAEVADVYGFSSVRSATVQKFKCLEKVRDTVKEKSLSYESFVE
jgi:DNA-directed RNA polymerase specialized sigma24 family protein